MPVLVYSVVRRHMKRTSPGAFVLAGGPSESPLDVALLPDEVLIGWYKNPPPWQDTLVFFTSLAFIVYQQEKTIRISIEDLVGYENPASKKDVSGVTVLTTRGPVYVRVGGCFGLDGNQKDAYSFIMVVRAVTPREPVVIFD